MKFTGSVIGAVCKDKIPYLYQKCVDIPDDKNSHGAVVIKLDLTYTTLILALNQSNDGQYFLTDMGFLIKQIPNLKEVYQEINDEIGANFKCGPKFNDLRIPIKSFLEVPNAIKSFYFLIQVLYATYRATKQGNNN